MMSPDHADTEEISLSSTTTPDKATTPTSATPNTTTTTTNNSNTNTGAAHAAAAIAAIDTTPQITSPPRVSDQPTNTAPQPQLRRTESEQTIQDDNLGLATVQSGLMGLWNTVSNVGVVKAAMTTAKTVADSAITHVQQHGIMQTAKDGAQAAISSARNMDQTYLHGTLGKFVDTTVAAARKLDTAAGNITGHTEGGAFKEDIAVVVASTKFEKVNAVRAALQTRYDGEVELHGIAADSNIASQPIGLEATRTGAVNRIASLRSQRQGTTEIIVSIESGIVELLPGNWMDVAVVILRDDTLDITIETVSQALPVPTEYVERARQATPSTYEHRNTGFSVTIGKLMQEDNSNVNDSDWMPNVCGVSRQTQLHVALVVAFGRYVILRKKALATTTATATGATGTSDSS